MSGTDRFIVRWEVSDGYAGGSRPHEFCVMADELEPDMTEVQIVQHLYDRADEEMRQVVSPSVMNEEKFLAWALKRVAEASSADD